MISASATTVDFIRIFAALEAAVVATYLISFAVIVVAILVIVARVPTRIWAPTETTCALCGDTRWCREINGRMVCPECRMDVRPAKRWWEP